MFQSDGQLILGFVILLAISCFTANYAAKKGRNPFVWFITTLFLGLIAPLIVYFLPPLNGESGEDPKSLVSNPLIAPSAVPEKIPAPDESNSMANRLWYYLDENHRQYGPVSLIALKEKWDTAGLNLNSYVWSEGMEKWEKVNDLPRLKEALHHPSSLF